MLCEILLPTSLTGADYFAPALPISLTGATTAPELRHPRRLSAASYDYNSMKNLKIKDKLIVVKIYV